MVQPASLAATIAVLAAREGLGRSARALDQLRRRRLVIARAGGLALVVVGVLLVSGLCSQWLGSLQGRRFALSGLIRRPRKLAGFVLDRGRVVEEGSHDVLMAREGIYAQVRLRSGEVRKIHIDCRATIGEVSNEEHSLRQYGKAGAIRWKGIRPTVRGVAMNPVDHPHGGGEGRTGEGQVPVSPWNTMTKGYRTRNNKRTQTFIVSRRKK